MKSYFDTIVDCLRKAENPITSKYIAESAGCIVETALKHIAVLRKQGRVTRQTNWTSQHTYIRTYVWVEKESEK